MLGGINPKQMQAAMKQMGIAQEDILADKVEIYKKDGTKTIISNPSIQKIKMQGQVSYQIAGEESEETQKEETSFEDIQTVMEKTNCSEEKAMEALKKSDGDLAEAIMELSN